MELGDRRCLWGAALRRRRTEAPPHVERPDGSGAAAALVARCLMLVALARDRHARVGRSV
jgi:hypothetical protein